MQFVAYYVAKSFFHIGSSIQYQLVFVFNAYCMTLLRSIFTQTIKVNATSFSIKCNVLLNNVFQSILIAVILDLQIYIHIYIYALSSNIRTNMNSKTMILSRLINLRIGNDPPWIGGNIRHFVRMNVSEIRQVNYHAKVSSCV